jgi:HSP20 family molecular chaperone IbpA
VLGDNFVEGKRTMNTVMKKTKRAAMVTLIVGLGVGLGIGVWSAKTSRASTAREQSSSTSKNAVDWDPVQQMEQMQREIDHAIRRATQQFEASSKAAFSQPSVGYSSSFDLRDRKDHYELRAYLPDAKASDVNVKIDNDRTLEIKVTQRKQETKNTAGGNASFTELGEYEQLITLPEPVRSSEMKIDRQDHEVVITIPKANAT